MTSGRGVGYLSGKGRCGVAAFFPTVKKIAYEGPAAKNPLAFKWYNPDEIVA